MTDAAAINNELLVEPLGAWHADEWMRTLSDPEIGRYIGGPDVTTRAALDERIAALLAGPPEHFAERAWINLIVRRADTMHMIGRLEAAIHDGWAEIAYVFDPSQSGHGWATKAVIMLLAHLQHMGIDTAWAAVHPDNARSIALLGRCGFTPSAQPQPGMGSYDPGDLVFTLTSPAQ